MNRHSSTGEAATAVTDLVPDTAGDTASIAMSVDSSFLASGAKS